MNGLIRRLGSMLRPAPPAAPSPREAARLLAARRKPADRTLIRKTAREMRERLGLPPSDALRDR